MTKIVRLHIINIAMAATLVFGRILVGEWLVTTALWVGLDWFLINLLNRVSDLDEDEQSGISGTGWVRRYRRFLSWACGFLLVGSLMMTAWLDRELLLWRSVVQAIGLAYNFRILPTRAGWRRFKALYFFKNTMSAVLFVLTVFVYPLVRADWKPLFSWEGVGILIGFFLLFEMTYEIVYDCRDVEGDRTEGIPTYPVVHGLEGARRIVGGLLLVSSSLLLIGFLLGWIGVREGLMLAAPLLQYGYGRSRWGPGWTEQDCIRLTHLGTAQLFLYLAGTAIWDWAGGPQNLWIATEGIRFLA
ncbi:MAG: UbiA family prenyltransferase [Planctomycetota bacterium]|jgi:4-hydroxybenzoate polyprenyltransferase|nr:UbiA family prenyltransferase [Planctomycetota bacterium]